jgi:hypothetical protein
MITVPGLAAETLGSYLADQMTRAFGATDARLTEFIPTAARLALECIGNSDALFHNVEHTMLVTLAGYEIMKGRALLTSTNASDFAHLLIACLFHDIGYVRGVLQGDGPDGYVIDAAGGKTKLDRGASDAALRPYHVNRSKLFVMERMGQSKIIDATRIARAIEYTRYRSPQESDDKDFEDGLLLRAADMIGQLGDPHYLRKTNALYYEYEESGMNAQLGYISPADLIDRYSQSYWNSTSAHIQTAIRYLNVTSSGRQWIATLYSNIFRAECDLSLSGPQH